MNILQSLQDAVRYVSEGVSKVFSPSDDHYPQTGVQPFEGDPFSKRVDAVDVKR